MQNTHVALITAQVFLPEFTPPLALHLHLKSFIIAQLANIFATWLLCVATIYCHVVEYGYTALYFNM